ncbi:protein-glutamate O-methyltransferase CheR [Paractinoplanes ferrugineus]|uniref:Protein-glutamate O-methyltransferase n=1 Tax=Paractinoplanes ferrugineus TaxID=113564 RepID=A0A919J4W9_9ACTN|nr:protein-glutamate O-methyltransferase CheR [Actinoplanes ferrugineus]GIE14545.1 protein-glutamate O-methyltransferase [Actinoplanes ferrugineus]
MTTEAEIGRFRELLARSLGWTFSDRDARQLGPLLADRAHTHRMSRTEYVNRLAARPWNDELVELIEQLSITETYFFRHGEQFRALREEAMPQRVLARAPQKVLRVLSVACSSGEEAYSLAIVAQEAAPGPDWTIDVTGIDANPAVLRQATEGWYSPWSLRETPAEVKRRWFRAGERGFHVVEEIQRLVRFHRQNVAEPEDLVWRPGQYDVIFCRNLLMYLVPEVAQALVTRMTECLVPGGYLFLGHTDSLGAAPAGLELRHTHDAFYYRRLSAAGPPPPPAPRPAPPVPPVEPSRPAEDVYQRTLLLFTDERYAEALALLPHPAGPAERLLCGVLLAQAGRLDEAVDAARRLIDDDGLNPDAHQLLGLCLEGATAVPEALQQYRLAAYLDPDFALPRMRLGLLARRQGDDRAASGELERALALLPGEHELRITLFGGGFGRLALTALCRSELEACGVRR